MRIDPSPQRPVVSGYRAEQVWLPFSENLTEWNVESHVLMLDDQLRMAAYSAAIAETVKPGDVVLDLGTGTGILGLLALRNGASRVYGVDLNPDILALAEKRLRNAGYGDRFTAIKGLSYEVALPERVDVIISELMGNISDNEDFVPILADARRRFLKAGGLLIPCDVETYLVPVSAEKAHAQVHLGMCQGLGAHGSLDQALARLGVQSRFDCYYDAIIPRSAYLSAPRLIKRFALDGSDSSFYQRSLCYAISDRGVFTGFKGYFRTSWT
ncbi:MAG TPA: methyltransferase domain-containing protein [Myxococcaceae bacterium]|nr:methyltransferase domain-containing protein [Myxococcaceae bacterium]